MAFKARLDTLTMETAVLGGAILGCGGGGKLEDGLYLGELATAQGGGQLVNLGSMPTHSNLAVVAPVHSSSSDTRQISPRQAHHAVEMLQSELATNIDGLVNAGQGAVDSIIGWELSGFLAVPLLDTALPATYHSVPLRNLFLYWLETAASETFTTCLVGRVNRNSGDRDFVWRDKPAGLLQKLDDLPNGDFESYVAVAGPLPHSAAADHGRFAIISRTLQVGEAVIAVNEDGGEATVAALQRILPCRFSTFATVTQISWQGYGQDAYGKIELHDVDSRHLSLTYSQRYVELLENGQQTAAFPDQIITLGILGTPLSGEEVFIGQDLYLIVAQPEE